MSVSENELIESEIESDIELNGDKSDCDCEKCDSCKEAITYIPIYVGTSVSGIRRSYFESHFFELLEVRLMIKRLIIESVFAVIMGYDNFVSALRLLSKHKFCAFDQLIEFIDEYQHIGFHVKANRYRVMEAFNALRGSAPFSERMRYPEEFYVHLDNPAIKFWTEQLLTALDLPDRLIERGAPSAAETYGMSSVTDAKRSYDVAFSKLAAITRMTDVVQLNKHGVYDRDSFERIYSLNWVQ